MVQKRSYMNDDHFWSVELRARGPQRFVLLTWYLIAFIMLKLRQGMIWFWKWSKPNQAVRTIKGLFAKQIISINLAVSTDADADMPITLYDHKILQSYKKKYFIAIFLQTPPHEQIRWMDISEIRNWLWNLIFLY